MSTGQETSDSQLWTRLREITDEQSTMGWTTGDKLDHNRVRALAKERREIEQRLGLGRWQTFPGIVNAGMCDD